MVYTSELQTEGQVSRFPRIFVRYKAKWYLAGEVHYNNWGELLSVKIVEHPDDVELTEVPYGEITRFRIDYQDLTKEEK